MSKLVTSKTIVLFIISAYRLQNCTMILNVRITEGRGDPNAGHGTLKKA